jgi:hypothetical protein
MALSAIGVRPRIALARAAGIAVGRGIVADRLLQTSAAGVYVLGDCAEVDGHVLYYVAPLMACARALAQTLAGNADARSAYPAMPVTIKTPACPVVVAPAPAGTEGSWSISGSAPGLSSPNSVPIRRRSCCGFALTGEGSATQKLRLQKPNCRRCCPERDAALALGRAAVGADAGIDAGARAMCAGRAGALPVPGRDRGTGGRRAAQRPDVGAARGAARWTRRRAHGRVAGGGGALAGRRRAARFAAAGAETPIANLHAWTPRSPRWSVAGWTGCGLRSGRRAPACARRPMRQRSRPRRVSWPPTRRASRRWTACWPRGARSNCCCWSTRSTPPTSRRRAHAPEGPRQRRRTPLMQPSCNSVHARRSSVRWRRLHAMSWRYALRHAGADQIESARVALADPLVQEFLAATLARLDLMPRDRAQSP